MKALLLLVVLQSFPTHHYVVTDVTAQPPVKTEEYDAGPCIPSDIWTGSFIFCATPTPTPTPTPPPPVIIFDCVKFNADQTFGGIQWPQGLDQKWACEGPWLGLKPASIYFSTQVGSSRNFSFLAPSVLVYLDVVTYQAGTLTLQSDAGEILTVDLAASTLQTLQTGWAKPASNITVTFSKGWALSIGNIGVR